MNIVFIPYRDRKEHLNYFLKNTAPLLKKYLNNLKIVIIEQNVGKAFNRGKLLNTGYKEYEQNIEYLFHHDIDTIPHEEIIKQLYTIKNETILRLNVGHNECLGGVIKFPKSLMIKINGFPNTIWGWGIEDRALYWRAKIMGINMSQIYNIHGGGTTSKFLILPHKTNAYTYSNEKKKISEIWCCKYLNTLTANQRNTLVINDGLNTVDYKIIKKEVLNDYIEKIVVDI